MLLTKLPLHSLNLPHLLQYLVATLKGASWLLFVLSPWILLLISCSLAGLIHLSNHVTFILSTLIVVGLAQIFLSRHRKKESATFSAA